MPSLATLNLLSRSDAQTELLKCCGSGAWAHQMTESRPFPNERALLEESDRIWSSLPRKDWLEAFSHHPRIGEKQLRERFAATASWATQEQQGTQGASGQVLAELATGNEQYERQFGFVFLICATGKSADEMLKAQRARMGNDPDTEIRIAAEEQAKITRIRLEKWLKA
jgi:2-oxo-4-hydroxy-4-carboxy-5-ureidoimidazoline decarboxylase